METQIQKWGNSLGVRIPAKLASALHLEHGKKVEIKIELDHIVIYPKKYDLSNMLQLINQDNMHNAYFSNEVLGEEIW